MQAGWRRGSSPRLPAALRRPQCGDPGGDRPNPRRSGQDRRRGGHATGGRIARQRSPCKLQRSVWISLRTCFQVHGIDAAEKVVVRKQLRRGQMLAFFEALPPCLVGMEACATSHYWARELTKLGHQVRLMPAKDVKAYVKRNKNDAADAEAICEAVRRPTMRFVPDQIGRAAGPVRCCIARNLDAAADPTDQCFAGAYGGARHCGRARARRGQGVAEDHCEPTGGKQKLGPISKQGDQYLRRILVVGAHAVLKRARHQPEKYPWVTRLLERKPFRVVAVAVANKMARVAWALLARGGRCRAPALAAAA